jgi:hypothetical protein
MTPLSFVLEILSACAFLFYGAACLFSAKLVAEFERYRLARWRVLVGSLEIAGAGARFGQSGHHRARLIGIYSSAHFPPER